MPRCPILLVAALVALPAAAAEWSNAALGVRIDPLPFAWQVERSEPDGLLLHKRPVFGDYRYDEWITLGLARDTSGTVAGLVRSFRNDGFRVVDSSRVALDGTEVPFWCLFRQHGDGGTEWLAIVMRNGVVFTLTMRSTPYDLEALSEFGAVLSGFRFIADPRDLAWRALLAGDHAAAERGFSQLVARDVTDANARYGLGLARLGAGAASAGRRELERARDGLGVAEDMRRALARAEFDVGDPGQAALLWLKVIRDDPGWDAELRPAVMRAIDRLESRGWRSTRDSEELALDIATVAMTFDVVAERLEAGQLVAGSQELETIRLLLEEEIDHALEARHARVTAQSLRTLLTALDLEQSVNRIVHGVSTENVRYAAEGRARNAWALRARGGMEDE